MKKKWLGLALAMCALASVLTGCGSAGSDGAIKLKIATVGNESHQSTIAATAFKEKLEELADNPAIIRNRRKIRAAVENARVFRDIQRERGTFSAYLWGFTGGGVIRETGMTRSELSDAVSKDLRRRGMTFVGTTIIYAYLQAVGVIDSHDRECFMYHENGK